MLTHLFFTKHSMQKVVLITGASSGIGKATALKLLQEGFIVYGAARSVDKMQDIVEAGGYSLEMDITNESQIVAGVKKVVDEQGRIDVLFNNAGYGQYGTVEETPLEKARYQFEVNLFGLARITQEVLPHMRAQKSGTIINTSSIGGKIYTPLGAWYHATKHALEGWSDSLRLELQQFNIDVVIIEPGIIGTNFSNVLEDNLPEEIRTGPYKDLVTALEESFAESYKEPDAFSPPEVIADVVLKAIQAKKPKTRYPAGKIAKQVLFLRKWSSDRMFDRGIMKRFTK